jgi:hypothetical protein
MIKTLFALQGLAQAKYIDLLYDAVTQMEMLADGIA